MVVFFVVVFFFPETFHVGQRGIDKVDPETLPKWRPVFLNPLKPLWTLRSPNLLAVVGFVSIPLKSVCSRVLTQIVSGRVYHAPH